MNSQKGSATVILLVVLVVVVAAVSVYFAFLKKPGEVAVSPTPTPTATAKVVKTATPTPKATVDPTANWKTYTSNNMGFEIRYPESWSIKEDVGIEVWLQKQLQPPVGYSITISVPSVTIQQLIAQHPDWGTVQSQKQITFAGKSATKIHFVGESGFTTDVTYIPRGSSNPVVITTGPLAYAETDQILSTFKFTK